MTLISRPILRTALGVCVLFQAY